MNLPHQEPIKFVKELIGLDNEYASISCLFPVTPTLAMVCEAAAQSSAAFAQDSKNIKIKKEMVFGSMSEFKFELTKDSIIYVKGYLVIALQNENSK